ncbi:MAG: helix-turn-helix transcriptional regulator [Marinospirillum sp.]|uniref:helix-turn-helix domain-containing protein n=1 Tax=Marinospirillum sp. TaxID=2183934 RepID=UPI0019F7EB83|nr:helix-turn-helix transcriptional regulator [Marinospirillum sp.]MBE0508679.1 helix-turn-helix transcriptional regulator [Marinospirillum sp.]
MKLKQYRVKAGLTQTDLAKAVGVSQPNYQRWESGAASIPEDKLNKLSSILQVDPNTIMGRHPPIEARLYDTSADENLNYYGEVAIHFRNGGKPLLISISDGAFKCLHTSLQYNPAFVAVESLSNQTVIIRTKAIADLYFSGEACDDYGPEHESYEKPIALQLPDPRDWEIVEALKCDDEETLGEFAPEDVKRISEHIMITDEQYEQLIIDGLIKPEDLEAEKAKNSEETDEIFNLATQVKYQLSTGQQRSTHISSARDLYEAFDLFTDIDTASEIEDDLIRLPIEDPYRIAFINPKALDYVVFPTHLFQQGQIEVDADFLDDLG